jgi:hypothetical protein
VKAESPKQPQKLAPYWFMVSGRAEVEIQGNNLRARLFDAGAGGELSHTLSANLSAPVSKSTPFEARARGRLTTLSSDAGKDTLSGTLGIAVDDRAPGKPVLHSLILHNAYSFVALSCYGSGAA